VTPPRRGLALVVVTAVLGVLAVLATCFVTLARIERRASQQRLNATKAFLLARCGIEDTLARIRSGQDPWTPTAGGCLGDATHGTYTLRIEGGGFHVNGGDPARAYDLGYNAVLRRMLGTLAEAIDRGSATRHGVLTEADGWALIDLRPAEGWKDFDQVRRLALGGVQAKLDLLKPYLCLHAWVDLKVIRPNVTEALADKEFQSWAEIRQGKGNARTDPSALPTRNPPDFERVVARLVGRAPVDLAWARRHRPALIALLAGLKGLYLGERSALPHRDSYSNAAPDCVGHLRTAEIRLAWDVPNDCETAADLILSCPDPLDTWEAWDRFCDTVPFPHAAAEALQRSGEVSGTHDAAWIAYQAAAAAAAAAVERYWRLLDYVNFDGQAELDAAQAEYDDAVANGDSARADAARTRMEEIRQAIRDAEAALPEAEAEATRTQEALPPARAAWEAAAGALDSGQDALDVEEACRAILKANFNPNSDLNKFNPNATQWKLVDKSDLLQYSTEFSLQPLACLRVSSTGRVLDTSGRLLALRSLATEVAGPAVLRLTTQGEFVAGDLGNPDVAGDEKAFRPPADPLYLGPSNGILRTWGKAFLTSPAEKGLSLQSYPEPYAAPGPTMRPASFDGSLQLATVETETNAFFGQPGGRMTCLGRFDDGFDLDAGSGNRACQLDAAQSAAAGVLNRASPSTLYPDGAYCERLREPAYLSLQNMPPRHGLLSFWVKSAADFSKARPIDPDSPSTRRGHCYFYASRATTTGSAIGNTDYTQFFAVAEAAMPQGGASVPRVGAFFEIATGYWESHREHQYEVQGALAPHRWHLASFYWDFESSLAPAHHAAGEFVLDEAHGGQEVYVKSTFNFWSEARDLTSSFSWSPFGRPHRFVLGSRLSETETVGVGYNFWGSGADATLDELAIYDFGQDPANAIVQNLAAARYADGRYYAGTDYTRYGIPASADRAPEWTSAPIRLPSGSRLEGVGWTLSPSLGYWLEVELLSADGAGYLEGNESAGRSGNVGEGQLWRTGRLPGAPFRAHAVFRRDAAAAGPLDTPKLDDLSFVYTPAGGRSILSWEGK